jgi:hypothetical protein
MSLHALMEMGPEGSDHTETLTVDLDEDQIKQLRIGEKITLTVKGSVGMLQVPPEGTSENDPPILGIRVTSKSVEGSNVFADLVEDNDE